MTYHHYFLPAFIASVLFMNAGTTGAATCPTSRFDLATQRIDIPCVLYQGKTYRAILDVAQGIPESDLAWKLNAASFKDSACALGSASCATTSNELELTLKQLDINGIAHTAKLAYTEHPTDFSGIYWQYFTHYPESGTKAIDLRVSYYDTYANTLKKKAQIEANLRHFSEGIYESSNGAHRLGKVTVFTDGAYADNTDILWRKETNNSGKPCWFNAHIAGRGKKGQRIQHCDMGTNHRGSYNMLEQPRAGGYTLAHEWGHFFYGLYDEYQGQSACNASQPYLPCTLDTPANISIMNRHWNAINIADDSLADLRWLNFSTIQSGSFNNAHYRMYGNNGWETLILPKNQDPQQLGGKRTYYPELLAVAPASGQTPSLELDKPEGIAAATQSLQVIFKPGTSQTKTRRTRGNDEAFFEWIGTVRQILIDRSATMTPEQLNNVKVAVQSLIDEAEIGDVIGIIAFDETATVIQPLTLIDSEAKQDALILAVEKLAQGSGKMNTGMALYQAWEGMQSAKFAEKLVHSVYLFTNGGQNLHDAALIEAAVAELAQQDVMLFILATTEDRASIETLRTLAEVAGGEFFLTTNRRRLQEALEKIQTLSSPSVDVTVTQRHLEFNSDIKVPFYLDKSLDEVEIKIAFLGSLQDLQITLLDPQGMPHSFIPMHCDDVLDELGENINEAYPEEGDEDSEMEWRDEMEFDKTPSELEYEMVFEETSDKGETGEERSRGKTRNEDKAEALVEYYTFCTMELYTPIEGEWVLQASPTKKTHRDLFLTVSAIPEYNDETFFASIWTEEEQPLSVKEKVIVHAHISRDMPITDIQVTVMSQRDNEALNSISMRDDGVFPDQIAKDGLYSGIFTPMKAGEYMLFAEFDNTKNYGHYSDFGIAYAPDPDGYVPEQELYPVNLAFQRFALTQVWVVDE
jgi:uncharacterized protein YegL